MIAYIKVVALIFKNMNFMYDVNDTCIKLLKIVLIERKSMELSEIKRNIDEYQNNLNKLGVSLT